MYTNLRHIVLSLLIFCFGINLSLAQIGKDDNKITKKIELDSLKFSNKKDLIEPKIDTTGIDSTLITKEFLEANIIHKAKDYIQNDFVHEKAYLYNEAQLFYKDIELKAGEIIIDYKNSLAYARGIYDSLGEYIQKPEFKQGQQQSVQDSLIYNFKNEKAIIYNSKTNQEGVIIFGDITKRENDSTFYINKARFTTSEKEHPDYYIQTSNIKVVPNSKIVGGWSSLVIADVPTPLVLPFFYSPITKGSASGFVVPTWGENRNQGYFLQNGGYYFNISDYIDLAVLGDIYTNGSWGIRTESNYALRYKFSGNLSFRFENVINSERGFPDYSKASNYFIRWSHSQAAQSNPTSRFSASVSFGSSTYFRQSLNELSSPLYLVNTFTSSISYFKKFVGTPFTMSASVLHTQNSNTGDIDLNLPTLNLDMDRIYPFAPRVGAKKNAIQNIGLNYRMSIDNRISTNEEEFLKPEMFDNAKSGIKQDVSMGTNIKFLKYLTLTPNLTFREVWNFKTIEKFWDDIDEDVVTDTINGFDSFREYGASVSASTTFYGTLRFKKGSLEAIRHVVRPAISYGYRPDFNQYYDEYQASLDPRDIRDYTRFQNGVYGGPSKRESNSIGFSLNNTLEAKVRSLDPEVEPKKLMLLNTLNLSTNYNLVLDSLQWSPLRMSAGTQLFKNKMNVNIIATMDPYAINANGTRINTFNINNGGSLFRLTGAGLTSNYSISSVKKDKKSSSTSANTDRQGSFEDDLFGKNIANSKTSESKNEEKEVKKAKLYNTVMPWDIRFQYSLTYTNPRGENRISSNSLQLSGNLEFSPKWNVGFSSGYDFENSGITYTQLRFERDLDSWRLTFNWVPFGDRATYYFFIGIKSSALSDLKYDKRQVPDKRLF